MPNTKIRPSIAEELANLFASHPASQSLLRFRPSKTLQKRAEILLSNNNEGEATFEEMQELDEFAHGERLMRLVKARINAKKAARS
jgi:hypothetical protein